MVTWVNGRVKLLPFLGMLMAMLTQSGTMVIIKFAMTDGKNKYVMVVYSMAFSSSILLPFVLFLYRSELPLLTVPALGSFFLLAVFASSAHIIAYVGIEVSSPNVAPQLSEHGMDKPKRDIKRLTYLKDYFP